MGFELKNKLRCDESDHHEQPDEHRRFLTQQVFNLALFDDLMAAVENTSCQAGIYTARVSLPKPALTRRSANHSLSGIQMEAEFKKCLQIIFF